MKKRCVIVSGPYRGTRGEALINSDGKVEFYPDSKRPFRLFPSVNDIDWNPPKTGGIKLDIPFELGQKVWVYTNNQRCESVQVPDGYDHLGRTYRLELRYEDNWEVQCHNFHFGLLDKFPISEIYASEWECRSKANGAF